MPQNQRSVTWEGFCYPPKYRFLHFSDRLLGEGGEQNAPHGHAVIGGLLFATCATLFLVPCVFAMIHGWLEKRQGHGGAAAQGPVTT
jgi:hypothetical protein